MTAYRIGRDPVHSVSRLTMTAETVITLKMAETYTSSACSLVGSDQKPFSCSSASNHSRSRSTRGLPSTVPIDVLPNRQTCLTRSKP